jgi:hypothetical protein
LTVKENAEMSENYRFIMDFEKQEKKMEIFYLKYIVYEIYTSILSNRFNNNKIFVCKYQLCMDLPLPRPGLDAAATAASSGTVAPPHYFCL